MTSVQCNLQVYFETLGYNFLGKFLPKTISLYRVFLFLTGNIHILSMKFYLLLIKKEKIGLHAY